jgi:hypothetical protein
MPSGVGDLQSLAWTPIRLPNALLVMMQSGEGYVWTQAPLEPNGGDQATTIDDWQGDVAFQASGRPGK